MVINTVENKLVDKNVKSEDNLMRILSNNNDDIHWSLLSSSSLRLWSKPDYVQVGIMQSENHLNHPFLVISDPYNPVFQIFWSVPTQVGFWQFALISERISDLLTPVFYSDHFQRRLVVENVHGAMAAPVQLNVEHPISMATVCVIIIIIISITFFSISIILS